MIMAMEILEAGPLTTVQDMGRRGYLSRGYQESGACDKYAMRTANLLCGNRAFGGTKAAVLEFTMKGGRIRFTSEELIAITGADMQPEINGQPAAMYRPLLVKPQDELSLGMAVRGLRGYLAVYGGIDVECVMGSRSTNLACHLGGYQGRSLKAGDVVRSGNGVRQGAPERDGRMEEEPESGGRTGTESKTAGRTHWKKLKAYITKYGADMGFRADEEWLKLPSNPYQILDGDRCVLLRAVLGPQDDLFTPGGVETLVHSRYKLQADSNRMACRLSGEAIETVHGSDIISDGIVEGSIQVPANGMPIVMMADHQTTGGYAKIGTVISTDIPALAQVRPGESVAFRFVTAREAVEIRRREEEKFQWMERRIWGEWPETKNAKNGRSRRAWQP